MKFFETVILLMMEWLGTPLSLARGPNPVLLTTAILLLSYESLPQSCRDTDHLLSFPSSLFESVRISASHSNRLVAYKCQRRLPLLDTSYQKFYPFLSAIERRFF